MPGMRQNDDGSVFFPLRPTRDEPTQARHIVIPEPSLEHMAKLYEIFRAVDDDVPTVVIPEVDADPAVREQFRVELRARTEKITGEMAYGLAIIDAIKLLTDGAETPEPADLFGWAGNPQTGQQLMAWFQAPLPGAE